MCAARPRCHTYQRPAGCGIGGLEPISDQAGKAPRWWRAWLLVDSLNRSFRVPVIASQKGGQHGGGAAMTEFGHAVVQHYRAVESAAEKAGAAHIKALSAALAKRTSPARKLTGEKTRRLSRNLS